MTSTSRSQIKRVRSQMGCTHDLTEREMSVTVDGQCPLCMLIRIEELEAKLELHDKTQYEMINKQFLKQLKEKIEELEARVESLQEEVEHQRYKGRREEE